MSLPTAARAAVGPAPPFDTVTATGPVRVLVAGAGEMGTLWLRAVQRHPDLELVGIADADERRAKGAALRLRRPDVPVAADLAGLDHVNADACINITPPAAHFPVVRHALRRGLAVLSEKPFAVTMAEAVRLTATAQAQRRLLMIGQTRRYEPGLSQLRDDARALGRLGMVTTTFSRAYRPDGFRTAMPNPLLLDMAIHAFDAVRYVTDARPLSVYCDAFNPPWSWYAGAAAAAAVIELSGGIRYVYTGSWCSDGSPTSWSGRWRLTGERGVAEWDGAEPVAGEDDGDPAAQVLGPLDDFVAALRSGSAPWGECQDNLLTLAMVQAAIASSRSGARVLIDDLLAEAEREASRCD